MATEKEQRYIESLFPDIVRIQDAGLREKVVDICIEAWKDGNYESIEEIGWWEGWRDIYSWSNVDHTNQAVACAIAIAEVAQNKMGINVNMDWLIAGGILHDMDKAVMCDGKTKELTPLGKLLPHAAYTVYLALKHKLPVEVVHMISTHTAFSVKKQMTVEALILHMADYSVADLRNIKEGVDYLWSSQPPLYAELGVLKSRR